MLHVEQPYLSSSNNSLSSIVSDGTWDWNLDGFKPVCNDSGEPAFEKDKANRFGKSFKDPIMSVTNPDTGGAYMQSLYVKASDPTQCKKYFLGYDTVDKSGFNKNRVPLVSSHTNPVFLKRDGTPTGLSMKITVESGGNITLKFYDDYDPYTITENTTWDGQIFLDEFTEIDNNSTLTILPGTTVYMGNNVTLVVRPGAKLVSEGTQQEPIRFVRAHPDTAWNRISLSSSAGSSIKWSLFDGGYINLSVASKNNTIEHSTFRNATYRTMQGWHNQDGSGNASATISYVLIENSPTVGLVSHYLDLDMSYTTIRNNDQAGLYISSNTVYPFHHNLIIDNGLSQSYRDGIEVKSSGTLYMHSDNMSSGWNKVADNADDQISNYGDLIVGASSGGVNHITGDYSGGKYLVGNYSSTTVDAVYNYWGGKLSQF